MAQNKSYSHTLRLKVGIIYILGAVGIGGAKSCGPSPGTPNALASLRCTGKTLTFVWVAVKELTLSHHTMDKWQLRWFLDYGSLVKVP